MASARPPVATWRSITPAFCAAVIAAVPPNAGAQAWSVRSGAVARSEYSDNYFFTAENPESAFVASISPFVTAVRRTETSDVATLLSVGANKVWGTNPGREYASGRIGVGGELREERSAWRGGVGFSRAPSLLSSNTPDGIILTLAYANAAAANGAYTYQVDERWGFEARAAAYDERYSDVRGGVPLHDNHGYSGGGSARYAYSDRTHFALGADYSYFSSDVQHIDSVTTVLGVAHSFSPELRLSGSFGYFWSDTKQPQDALGNRGRLREDGPLFGGDVSYVLSDSARLVVSLSEKLTPTAAGVLSRHGDAIAVLTYRATDRLTSRFAVSYRRDKFLSGVGSTTTTTNHYFVGEIGATYRIAERWTLEAGYRYAQARYPQDASEPRSNAAFVSIGYNWPDASFTNWLGSRPGTADRFGAGPVLPSDQSSRTPGERPGSTGIDDPLFEPFFIP